MTLKGSGQGIEPPCCGERAQGMQRTIDNEIRLRKTAEGNICFVRDCELRKPRLGTYNKE